MQMYHGVITLKNGMLEENAKLSIFGDILLLCVKIIVLISKVI